MINDLFSGWDDSESGESEEDLDLLQKEMLSASIHSTDWTVETIVSQVSKGRIDLNPSFQRRDAWNIPRKSAFIESLIMQLPVPQLVLAEDPHRPGKFIVIDGKQRLLSLSQFYGAGSGEGGFKLKSMDAVKGVEGKTYSDLLESMPAYADSLDNSTIRTIVIRNWKDENLIYLIFLRLNMGSVKLSPQELRNALHPGEFALFVDRYSSESVGMRRIFGESPDFRMRDAELLLRYLSFVNKIRDYRGSMKFFLDETHDFYNNNWDDQRSVIERQCDSLEICIESLFDSFRGMAFKKFSGGKFENRFNRAVFDVLTFYACYDGYLNVINKDGERLLDLYIALSRKDVNFIKSIESTTKSVGATAVRLGRWGEALNREFGLDLPVVHVSKDGNGIVFD